MALPGRKTLMLAGAAGAYLAVRARRRRAIPDLQGRTVLVTGGSRGLGLALARALVHEGAHVVICGRDTATLERARVELDRLGGSVLAVPCDVTDPAQVDEMAGVVRDWLGPIDVLINNAGTIVVGPESSMALEDFEDAMRVNYWGAVHTIRTFLPDLRRRAGGRIVNVSSIGGLVGVPHLAAYSASKFALTGLSLALRAELGGDGVVVTTVCPGLMRTGSPPNAWFKGRHRAEYAWFSISDSLPGVSISVEHAAERILTACRRGEALAVFPAYTRLAALLQAAAPELVAAALELVDRALPRFPGPPNRRVRGWESRSALSPSWLTTLGDRATARYNQTTPIERSPVPALEGASPATGAAALARP